MDSSFFFNILAVSYLAVEEDSSFLLLMIYWSSEIFQPHLDELPQNLVLLTFIISRG